MEAPRGNLANASTAQRSRSRADSPGPLVPHDPQVRPRAFQTAREILQGPPGLPTPAQNQPQPVTSQLLLTQLLQAQNMQNQMLAEQLEQLKLMQQQYSAHPSKTYTQPQDILDAIDPSLARELAKWAKDYKSSLNHAVTQQGLQHKYQELEAASEIHKQFQTEALKKWQWPDAFKATAKKMTHMRPVLPDGEADEFELPDGNAPPFNIEDEFAAMRRRHAKECHDFVLAYQRQCTQFFQDEVHTARQMIKAEDILHAWTRKNRAVLTPSVQESLQQQVKLFVELTFRTEQPKALSRCEREREQHTNKKEALVKAEAEFRLMDVNKLLAMAVLEYSSLQSGSEAKHKKRTIPRGGL